MAADTTHLGSEAAAGKALVVEDVDTLSAGEDSFVNEVAETAEIKSAEADADKEDLDSIALDAFAPDEQVVSSELAATEKMFDEANTLIEEPISPAVKSGPTAAEPVKICPACDRPLLLKEDRFGKYWYCSGHP